MSDRGRCPWNGLAEEGSHDDLTNWARHNCRLPSPKAARRLTKSPLMRLNKPAERSGGNGRLPRVKIFASYIVRSLLRCSTIGIFRVSVRRLNEFEPLSSDSGS